MQDDLTLIDTPFGPVATHVCGTGPAVVLAHGWPWSMESWHRVLPALADCFTIYRYDMPGYGASGKTADQPTDLGVQGQVLCAMLDHWSLERPHLVAHDMGGAIALRAHLLHDRDLASLSLMNVVAMRPWGSEFFDHVGRHVDAFTGLPPHIHAALAEAYMRGALAHPIPEDDIERLLAPWLDDAGRASFYRQFAAADEALTAAFEPRLGQMRCPVSIYWGTDDPWIPLARGEELARRIGVPLTRWEGLGHLPQLEDPDRVSQALLTSLPMARAA